MDSYSIQPFQTGFFHLLKGFLVASSFWWLWKSSYKYLHARFCVDVSFHISWVNTLVGVQLLIELMEWIRNYFLSYVLEDLSFQSQTFLGAFGKLRALGTSGPSLSKPHQVLSAVRAEVPLAARHSGLAKALPTVEDTLAVCRWWQCKCTGASSGGWSAVAIRTISDYFQTEKHLGVCS